MKFAKRLLIVAGSVVLTGALAAIIAPKTTHAVTALMVQVSLLVFSPTKDSQLRSFRLNAMGMADGEVGSTDLG